MKMSSKFLFPINRFTVITLIFAILIMGCDKDDEPSTSYKSTDLCLVKINDNFEEIELDEVPIFLNGGEDGFIMGIGEAITYPPEARENGIEGLCIINYEITEEGKVENIEAIQDPGGNIGDSVIGIVESVTEGISFSPGILDNNPVRVKKELELEYKIQ